MRPHLTRKFTLFNRWNHGKSSTSTPPKLRLLARAAVPLIAAFTVIGLAAAPASANRRQDAMSWALRRLGTVDPEAARSFVNQHREQLASLIVREVNRKLETGRKDGRKGFTAVSAKESRGKS